MSDHQSGTGVGWAWPPWVNRGITLNHMLGCTPAGGPGCHFCWAQVDTWTRQNNPNPKMAKANAGLTVIRANGRARWTGKINLLPERFAVPFKTRGRLGIFSPSKSDPWHESVMASEDGKRHTAAAIGLAAVHPQHTLMMLTKRTRGAAEHDEWIREQAAKRGVSPAVFCMEMLAEQFRRLWSPEADYRKFEDRANQAPDPGWPLPNLWVLASTETQEWYDARVPDLLRLTMAGVLGLSIEPMLGPVTIADEHLAKLGWILCGGEAGPGSRPLHPAWPRALRDQCVAAGVPYFWKQWGDWMPETIVGQNRGPKAMVSSDGARVDAGKKYRHACVLPVENLIVNSRPALEGHPDRIIMVRVGKGKAGNMLDGEQWEQYPPEPRAT